MLKLNLMKFALITSVRNLRIGQHLLASTNVLAESNDSSLQSQKAQTATKKFRKNPTIAAVFASLGNEDESAPVEQSKQSNIDNIIMNAKTVNGLLSIPDAQKDLIERRHALKIVSILADWSSIGRANLSEFENDPRFIKLCRMLGRAVKNNNNNNIVSTKKTSFHTSDLDTVLSVKNDDEAAKLVASITLAQMVKVMKNLGMKKHRSTPLLRSLACNISGSKENMNIKECSDVLYAISSLNFPESNLLAKLCNDIQLDLKNSKILKSSAIGSVLKSLSFLKYREPAVLDDLAEWVIKNQEISRTQDIVSLCITLASLNYMPTALENEIKTKLIPSLTSLDFKNSLEYLTFVWSLLALNIHIEEAFDSVLKREFIDQLAQEYKDEIPIGAKIKLLNINGGVKLFMPSYKGAMLDHTTHESIYNLPLVYNQDKQLLCKAMTDALKNIVPEACLKTNVDTRMGFVVDAEFFVDAKSNPVSAATNDCKRIALMINGYHDTCQGPHQYASGISALNCRLLTKAGYEVISIHHSEFSVNDLLLKRVQYLQNLLKLKH